MYGGPVALHSSIHWDSRDGHLNGFCGSVEFKHFFADVQPFIPFIEEMRHYDLTTVHGEKTQADL